MAQRLIETSSKIEGKPSAYIMILSSRTLSRRLVIEDWRRSHIHGKVMNDNESVDSNYEDDCLSFEQLELSRIYWNVQAHRQENQILACHERQEGRPCGGTMS